MNEKAMAPQGAAWHGLAVAGLMSLGLGVGLTACGGGGGGSDSSTPPPVSVTPTPEVLQPSSSYAQRCAPANLNASASSRTGSLGIEKQWLRSYFDEAYLWREDVPSVDASRAEYNVSDVAKALDNYFNALLSPKLSDSGAYRDRFSFTIPTAEWQQQMEAGVEAGYGVEWSMASATPPRRIRVAYVEPGGAAAAAGVRRGDELVSADGYGADAGDSIGVAGLNAALYPSSLGVSHRFSLLRSGTGIVNVDLVSANVSKSPVLLRQVLTASDGARVGHLVFNDHALPAEAQLIEAVNYLKGQSISELVLDLRYNGGGYLFIASELAYMIAGPAKTQDRVFERLSYNSRRSAETSNTPFYSTACLASGGYCTSTQALPTLNLSRVYVLTQNGTCSASESIINGLRGVDVEVVQIGGQTCGKPYGFTAKDNCGISYLPIEFVGVNAKGFGDYADGFVPAGSATPSGRRLPGCEIDDDFSRALGDPAERMLAAALSHRTTGQCPARSGGLAQAQQARAGEGQLAMTLDRSPLRSNRFAGGR